MTRQDIAKLLHVVKAAYPQSYARFTSTDFDNMISAWQMTLEDYTPEQAGAGLRAYLKTDTRGFPPSPGQIVDCISKLTAPAMAETSALEAWAMVRKAIRNGLYGAEEEFQGLPLEAQKAVGSPANLREMAQLDTDRVETVEQSHFIRAYETLKARTREEAKIPPQLRALAQKGVRQLEEHH